MSPFPILKDSANTLAMYSGLTATSSTRVTQPFPTSNDLPLSCVSPYNSGSSSGLLSGFYCWDTYQLTATGGVRFINRIHLIFFNFSIYNYTSMGSFKFNVLLVLFIIDRIWSLGLHLRY